MHGRVSSVFSEDGSVSPKVKSACKLTAGCEQATGKDPVVRRVQHQPSRPLMRHVLVLDVTVNEPAAVLSRNPCDTPPDRSVS